MKLLSYATPTTPDASGPEVEPVTVNVVGEVKVTVHVSLIAFTSAAIEDIVPLPTLN